MNKGVLKQAVPHLIAIGIFLLMTLIFCRPGLESGAGMRQNDITSVAGMSHQLIEHAKNGGTHPLWATNMFSGMPAWQILFPGVFSPLSYIDKMFQLWLPKPFNFFFLACIGFYILCTCIKVRPWVAILGSLAFAYCSYNPIIVTEGHDTKMLALAYAPALLGGVILIYEGKYLLGLGLTSLFASLHLMQNHPQVSYYLFLTIGIMTIAYLIRWAKGGLFFHLTKAIGLTIVAAVIGLLINAVILFPVYDFTKESKRGGQLVMNEQVDNKTNTIKNNKTIGLSKEYAFQWSYGKMESLSLMFPGVSGYGLTFSQKDGEQFLYPRLDENSNVSKTLVEKLNVPEEQASGIATQLSQSLYWGDQPFTRGPVYLGAIVCFLFIFAMFYIDPKYKWWLLAASAITIMMAWGKYFPALNYFLFDYMPMYNKFRVPTMILIIPQLLFPIAGVLAIEKLIDGNKDEAWKKLKPGLIATGAVFLIAGLVYATSDFSNENKQRTAAFNQIFNAADPNITARVDSLNALYPPKTDNSLYENFVYNTKGNLDVAKNIVGALKKDRASLFGQDILRSFVFVLLAAALLFLYTRNKISTAVLLAGLPLLVAIDLIGFGSHYLNDYNFDTKESFEAAEFPLTETDKMILADKDPNFRVFNLAGGDPFQESKTSYYHKSIGGYHPAKLGIYDDLITYQLSGKMNSSVVNMLNVKYFIQQLQGASQNQQAPQTAAIPNPGALGNCWFVKNVQFVNGPVAEMKALDQFNPKDTAIADASYKGIVGSYTPADSNSYIKQTAFDNDAVKYESNSSGNNFAVFSEIYYKDWKAYIDGKKVPTVKVNYVLRGLNIPAGKHTIDFKFESDIYNNSKTLATIANWVLIALLAAIGFLLYRKRGLVKALKS